MRNISLIVLIMLIFTLSSCNEAPVDISSTNETQTTKSVELQANYEDMQTSKSIEQSTQKEESQSLLMTTKKSSQTSITNDKQTETQTSSIKTSYASPLTHIWKIDWDNFKIFTQEEVGSDFTIGKKRYVYYSTIYYQDSLVDKDRIDQWYVAKKRPDEINEMENVSFIKDFDITREQYENAFKSFYESDFGKPSGSPNLSEFWEVVNIDLIYTFNNEKINDYYSRDRKKAKAADEWLQKWLETNKPYDSYAEYKAANP